MPGERWQGAKHHNVGRASAGQKLWVCAVSSKVVATSSRDGDDDATNCEIGRRPLEGVISGQMIATGPGIRVTLAGIRVTI